MANRKVKTRRLKNIHHEIGFCYWARTWHPELSSHRIPSPAIVKEDGVPLPGPANAPHDDIRKIGKGRYSFWHSRVYFSSSDNSDPRSNGRVYEIEYVAFNAQIIVARLARSMRNLFSLQNLLWTVYYKVCFMYVLLLASLLRTKDESTAKTNSPRRAQSTQRKN
ncbi:hypothetical protein D6779_04945 [Candidatus Parcubacteria bacterium]|nr:MAG: hypothetical protein D6779_04945 [Candidatus Parcubacteria bacterium]